MATSSRYVILGASLTGGTAAATLRKEGFDGEIVLVGAEPDPPYEPPLSKDYLRRESPRDNVFLNTPQYYEEQQIELRLGQKAARLNAAEKRVVLELGRRAGLRQAPDRHRRHPRELAVPGSTCRASPICGPCPTPTPWRGPGKETPRPRRRRRLHRLRGRRLRPLAGLRGDDAGGCARPPRPCSRGGARRRLC